MINSSRIGFISYAICFGALACGDDKSDQNNNNNNNNMSEAFLSNDGGEVRVERVDFGDHFVIIGHAYFIDTQTPDGLPHVKFPGCTNMRQRASDGNYYAPLNPNGWEIGNRTYRDVGEKISISYSGGTFDYFKALNVRDGAAGRLHNIAYLPKDGAGDLSPFAVSEDKALYNEDYHVNVQGTDLHATVRIPNEITITSPAGVPGSTPVNISSSQNLKVEWRLTKGPSSTMPGPGEYLFFAVVDDMGLSHFCIYPAEGGSYEITADEIKDWPTDGEFFAGVGNQYVENFGDRRVDLIGTNCKHAPYHVVP